MVAGKTLNLIGESRKKHLTPKEKTFYKEIISLKKKYNHCAKKNIELKKRISYCKRFAQFNESVMKGKMDPFVHKFFSSQLRNYNKKKTGKRFTFDDKILSVILYKQSPKTYRFLSKLFILPSVLTLKKLLQSVNIEPGICNNLFDNLAIKVKNFPKIHKVCILAFDEMSLQPHLEY